MCFISLQTGTNLQEVKHTNFAAKATSTTAASFCEPGDLPTLRHYSMVMTYTKTRKTHTTLRFQGNEGKPFLHLDSEEDILKADLLYSHSVNHDLV